MILQIGISQIQNNIQVKQNLSVILDCISKHQKVESNLVLFPECALTGFTSLVKNTVFTEVLTAFDKIQNLVDSGITSAMVPTVIKSNEGGFINAGFYFQPNKPRIFIAKEGLTESEQKFFTSGSNNYRQFEMNGYKIAFLICIEAAHEPWRYLDENDKPDLILWPAYWGKDEIPVWNESLTKDDLKVYQNNKIWKVPILRATYFENHENVGLSPGPYGQSLVINQDNELFYSAAKSAAEDYIVNFQKNKLGITSVVSTRTLS